MTKPSCALAFSRAVLIGAAVGTAPYTVMTGLIALDLSEHNDPLSTLTLAIAPLIIGLPICLVGMLAIGIPATTWLRQRDAESLKAYGAVGAVGGAVLALIPTFIFVGGLDWQAVVILCPGGALAGLAASYVWSRHRMRLLQFQQASDTDSTDSTPNPIHDLLF